MSRAIKFRAWFEISDAENSFSAMIPKVCVYDSQQLGCSDDDFITAIKGTGWAFDSYDECFVKDKSYIEFGNANVSLYDDYRVTFDGKPMQFTGLLDKDGKEIWEGDILCWPKYEGTKNQTRWAVEWDEKQAGWSMWSPRDEARIVGNIHENPELLVS